MKLSIKHILLSILSLTLISCAVFLYLNKSTKKDFLNSNDKIETLESEILNLEISNLKKNYELLEAYNYNVVLNRLQTAKANELKLQEIYKDSIVSEKFQIKYKEYNDCVNLLYNTTTHETIHLQKKILDLVEKAGENKKNNLHTSTIQKDVKYTSSLILNKKNNIENICAKFDSLHFVINTYIK